MKTPHNQYTEIFKPFSELEITKELPKDIASDALSMIYDAVNSTVGGLIITDLNGIIRFANPSFYKMFDYSSTEIIGDNAADLFSTKEVRTFSDVITIVDISRDNIQEFIVEKKDGKKFIVEVSASNVTSVSGLIVGRMASFVDISKRKEVEADRKNLSRSCKMRLIQ